MIRTTDWEVIRTRNDADFADPWKCHYMCENGLPKELEMTCRLSARLAHGCIAWAIVGAIGVAYWFVSRAYPGPAYLSDEIGYLTKGAALAGYPVDMATSWHAGYGFFLAPLFLLFSDPLVIWQGVMVLNALLWALSFALLFYVLRRVFPEHRFSSIALAVSVSAIYPAWVTMSGYAFSSSAFAFVMMLVLTTGLMAFREGKAIIPFFAYSLLVGFTFWVHPTGLAVAGSSVVAVAIFSMRRKSILYFATHIALIALMLVVYKFLLHPWLDSIMTPEGQKISSHYKSFFSTLRSMGNPEFVLAGIMIGLGHISYLAIATFGVVFFAVAELRNRLSGLVGVRDSGFHDEGVTLVLLVAVLSVLGVVGIGALSFGTMLVDRGSIGVDHRIYGRYAEGVLLPLLGIGLAAAWTRRWSAMGAGVVWVSCIIFIIYDIDDKTLSRNNLVNIPGFWPAAAFPEGGLLFWLFVGSAAVVAVGLVGKRVAVALLVVPSFFYSSSWQMEWHARILSNYSRPSEIVNFVRDNFASGTCVAIDPTLPDGARGAARERRNLYSFYLYDYDFQRMSISEWEEGCEGPYLTFSGRSVENIERVTIVGRVESNQMFVAVRDKLIDQLAVPDIGFQTSRVSWNISRYGSCLLDGCFDRVPAELVRFSQVGGLERDVLRSNGRRGFLFYGPYRRMSEGKYRLIVRGTGKELVGTRIDVVSERGQKIWAVFELGEVGRDDGILLDERVAIEDEVADLEVRMRVEAETDVWVVGYEVTHWEIDQR